MNEMSASREAVLSPVGRAAKELSVSRGYIYRLPRTTPGIYRLGRAIRVDITELKKWARSVDGEAI